MRSSVRLALLTTAALTAVGTGYSVLYATFLDTSDPAITSLPHPLHATHFFASKANPLNVLFIKRLWLHTTLAFGALFLTAAPASRTRERLLQFAAATAVWAAFTSWFFGPALLERLIAGTGGECVVSLPSGYVVPVPAEYCFAQTSVSPATHPALFAASLQFPELDTGASWKARPRLRRGHDVSGHIFLLTMSTLFLVDQLAESGRVGPSRWPKQHKWAVAFATAVVILELFATYVTSVYFHSPGEKFTGYLLGLAGFYVTQLPFFQSYTPINAPVPALYTIPEQDEGADETVVAKKVQ